MVGGGDGLGSSRSSGLAVFALGVTLPREPCHPRQAPGARDRSWTRTQPLWVVQGYGPRVSCSLPLSLLSQLDSSLLLMTVCPGQSQGLAESCSPINMCWIPEYLQTWYFTVYKTPSPLLSHLILKTTLRGRSFDPILQMRKLRLRERKRLAQGHTAQTPSLRLLN